MDISRMDTLLRWCSTNHIEIDKRLRIVPDATGLAVYSGSASIGSLETLVKISKLSVLSVKSCSAARLIENSGYGLEAQLALSLALTLELHRGPDSQWYGYLQSLPDLVDLPVFWDSDALEWLKGTEAERLILGPGGTPLIDHIRTYFDETVATTLTRLNAAKPPPTLQHFFRAYSLVSSRAFLVDSYHGLSMVPIADAFNHTYEHHVHLETEFQVCPECGSLKQCAHDWDLDDSVSPPFSTRASGSVETHDDSDDSYDMVSNTAIPPNSEVFNTYGETLTNAQLLTQYGFVLDVNENDHVSWEFDDLVQFLDILIPRVAAPTPRDALELTWTTLVQSFDQSIFSDSELIFPHGSDRTTFCVNCEGKISWQLWLLIASYICARLGSTGMVPATADEILALLTQLGRCQVEQETDQDDGDDEGNVREISAKIHLLAKSTASAVVALCQQRKTCFGDGRDLKNLGDIMDELDGSRTGTRMKQALSLVMTEISILNSCQAAWGEMFPMDE